MFYSRGTTLSYKYFGISNDFTALRFTAAATCATLAIHSSAYTSDLLSVL
jgi:hypothetical protein